MSFELKSAFVLAAGRGERLRPLTDKTPKPLLPVKGKPILDSVLRQMIPLVNDFGLKRVVLNAWHLGEQVIRYAEERKSSFGFELVVSLEPELLGTGGGLRRAYPSMVKNLGEGPIVMINGDCLWSGDISSFVRRAFEDSIDEGAWWLAAAEDDQTKISVEGRRLIKIGSLWRDERTASGLQSPREGCFSGIQFMREVDVKALPEKGCIIRDYWIPKLKSGAHLAGDFEGLNSWIDLGTPTRYEKVRD